MSFKACMQSITHNLLGSNTQCKNSLRRVIKRRMRDIDGGDGLGVQGRP